MREPWFPGCRCNTDVLGNQASKLLQVLSPFGRNVVEFWPPSFSSTFILQLLLSALWGLQAILTPFSAVVSLMMHGGLYTY